MLNRNSGQRHRCFCFDFIRDGQNLNFAIPSNYLKTLLTKVGITKPLAQAKPTKGQRSLLADFGSRSVEGVTGGKFTWVIQLLWIGTGLNYTFSLRNKRIR